MVLFLFVVMMIDINLDELKKGFWNHFPLAASMGAVLALELASVLMGGFRSTQINPGAGTSHGSSVPNTQELGATLYADFLYPLEIAGHPAWAMRFEGERYPENFIEVISDQPLRPLLPASGQLELKTTGAAAILQAA